MADAVPGADPPPVWSTHLDGAEVTSVSQQGWDRIIEIGLKPRGLYSTEGLRLVFEATGRNGNIVLVREGDSRIIAVLRRVTRQMSRFRTVVPGALYSRPPSSGAPPGLWADDPGIRDALTGDVSEREVFCLLEGVGPVTARALIREARASGTGVHRQASLLASALLKGEFHHWMGPDGPLPIRLGPGTPIEDPLTPKEPPPEASPGMPAGIEVLRHLAEKEMTRLERKIGKLEEVLDNLVPADRYRLWAELLLSAGSGRKRGVESIDLTDWEGNLHTIPLRKSRTLQENAARYFRKAGSASKEAAHLESLLKSTRRQLSELSNLLESGDGDAQERLAGLLEVCRRSRTGKAPGDPVEVILSGGWRCFAGRNAAGNDRVTFRIGRRGDYWFHARGTAGAHVVLKMEGRGEEPPSAVIREAAAVAASRCGSPSGVVPVDYTRVQYVRKPKGGKPGQVVYTREKTLFIDLDRQMPMVLDSVHGDESALEGESSES
jgi:predicted ribosome quality control (RQC) complex YloA/Tae2 family protein